MYFLKIYLLGLQSTIYFYNLSFGLFTVKEFPEPHTVFLLNNP